MGLQESYKVGWMQNPEIYEVGSFNVTRRPTLGKRREREHNSGVRLLQKRSGILLKSTFGYCSTYGDQAPLSWDVTQLSQVGLKLAWPSPLLPGPKEQLLNFVATVCGALCSLILSTCSPLTGKVERYYSRKRFMKFCTWKKKKIRSWSASVSENGRQAESGAMQETEAGSYLPENISIILSG